MRRPAAVTVLALFYALTAPFYLWQAMAGDDPRGRLLYPLGMAALAALAAPGLWKLARWGWLAAVAHETVRLLDLFRDAVTRVLTGQWPQFTSEQLRTVAGATDLPVDVDAAVWLPALVVVSGATAVLTYLSVQWPLFFALRAELVQPPAKDG